METRECVPEFHEYLCNQPNKVVWRDYAQHSQMRASWDKNQINLLCRRSIIGGALHRQQGLPDLTQKNQPKLISVYPMTFVIIEHVPYLLPIASAMKQVLSFCVVSKKFEKISTKIFPIINCSLLHKPCRLKNRKPIFQLTKKEIFFHNLWTWKA